MNPDDHAAARKLAARSAKMPCAYCGKMMVYGDPDLHPTRDHIWPKAVRSIAEGRVGTVWCCARCNREKGDMMPAEWLSKIEAG